jgi:hypothetical protein
VTGPTGWPHAQAPHARRGHTVFTAASAASVIGQQVKITRGMTLEVLGTGS